MKSFLPVAAVVVGVVLLLGSLFWGVLFPASRGWTEEKSMRLAELGSQANLLKFKMVEAQQNPRMHAGTNPAEIKAEYDKAEAEWKSLQEEFNNASESPKTAATFLRWSGVAFVAAGACVVFASRNG